MGTRRRRPEHDISKEDVLRSIHQAEGRSANLRQLLLEFDATPTARRQLKDILTQLVKDGKLQQHKGSRFEAPKRTALEGTIILHRDGYGFVVPSQKVTGVDSDIFIPPALTGSAMNGDTVKVEITYRKPGGRAEGRILDVVKRARETIVGQLRFDGSVFFVTPADEKLPEKILIPDALSEHKDRIVEVQITRFPTAAHWPAGKIVSVIGFLDDPNVETQVIIKKFGLPTQFPKEVEEEAAMLPDSIRESDLEGRDDFRKRTTITIDPTTARDFDDAIDVNVLPDGSFQLGVHIADVAHFVQPGSAMDREARIRGTSVYFPDRVLPMLPEKVSNHLCSLNPRSDRLAMSVMMHISRDGTVRDYSFHNSVIHSSERMTYDDVQKIIDGDETLSARYASILPEIRKIDRLARLLQKRRRESGAIDFDLPEPMLTYNDQGDVTGIVKAIRHFSHRIVEEFMVLANEVVAQHLEGLEVPSIYRIHEEPDPAKVEAFAEMVSTFGLKFRPKKVNPAEFQKFIASIEGRPDERMLSYLMLRSFKQAVYSPRNAGHFGLASDAYTHFTSPIRRYPDLVVHRILKNTIARRQPALSPAQLEAVASESSERERMAAQAERELFEWKKMLLMEKYLGETFDAVIIGVSKDGFMVEILEQFVEGFVSVADLPDGQYRFDVSDRILMSRNGKRRFRLGNRLQVQVARVDKLLRRAY
ncbi:MAG TPA: ribonuclease R, partial [Terriglobia bacterium]|nr:ribonuclease R [Terriglobia bacterium]